MNNPDDILAKALLEIHQKYGVVIYHLEVQWMETTYSKSAKPEFVPIQFDATKVRFT